LRQHAARQRSRPTRSCAIISRASSGLIAATAKRGFFHDGRFPTLLDVTDHYNACFNLGLSSAEKSDLVEFLKSR
jgi:hypothetical protein